jgi:predicted SnoaL-like aldol condensation-catalyzing enzyme
MTELEKSKQTVVAFYERAFNEHQPADAVARYVVPKYIQHNPGTPDGAEAFVKSTTALIARCPGLRVDIKRVIAEGDLVVAHNLVTTSPGSRGMAGIDIFRLENGKIVEHWDARQPVVLLANSDLLDTLRVERLPFPHPSFSDIGYFGSDAGLLSRPCVPSDGGACSSAPTQCSQALGQAAEADRFGPVLLGMFGSNLAELALCADHGQTGDGHWLAPKRLSLVLELEIAARAPRSPQSSGRDSRTDSQDER